MRKKFTSQGAMNLDIHENLMIFSFLFSDILGKNPERVNKRLYEQ